jgi:hypothetical protein
MHINALVIEDERADLSLSDSEGVSTLSAAQPQRRRHMLAAR